MTSEQPPLSALSKSSRNRAVPLSQSSATSNTSDEQWDLGWLAAVFRRRAGVIAAVTLGTIVAAGGLLFYTASTATPKYAGKFQLLVEPVTAEEQQARSSAQAQGSEVPLDTQQIDVERSGLDYETQIRILQSSKLMDPIVEELKTRYPDITYEKLILNLKIARITTLTLDKRERSTKLIEVSYQDADPNKVQDVLEQVSQAYLRYSLKERQSSIRQGIKFIDGQMPQLRARVNSLQRQLQDLRQRNIIVDPVLQAQQLSQQAGTLGQQRADSQTQLAEAQTKQSTLNQQLQAANLPTVLGEAPYYESLLTQYQEVEGKIASESARLQPDNPQMQALLEKRQNLQNLLRAEASRVVGKAGDSIAVAEARDRAIAQSTAQVNQKIQQLPAVARQYSDLQRELTLATESLNKFSTRREALEIDAAQQEIPWELLTPPQLTRNAQGNPVNVGEISKVQFLALIAVLSILLGVGVGFLVEISQDVLQTADEAKRAAKLPLLGTIPLDTAKKAPFIEAFRSVYKNIRLLPSLNGPVRSLTVSSAEPGDGKTTIAVNLAHAAAAMGQRVLLVDADLRHAQVHHQMNLPNTCGLSDILASKANVRNAIQQSPMRENLAVLTAGQTVVDPLELLSSGKMQALMERFQMVFDLVIYDTPPLLGLADSGLIASETDGLVLVTRLGKTKRATLSQTLEELKLSATAVLGLVANGSREPVSTPHDYYRPRQGESSPSIKV